MPITLFELIDKAAEAMGSQRALAAAMNKKPPRLSEWKSGEAKPDAHEIAFLARKAGLPVLETVAEIEAQLDSRYSEIWREALGKLKAAGIAASVAVITTINPGPADAAPRPAANYSANSLYIMSTIRRMYRWLMASRLNPATA
jgi:transcriptional regulator with XRE-family HTH domain